MPGSTFRRVSRTLIVCATLAFITIQVVDRSIIERTSRQLLGNTNENPPVAITNNPQPVVRDVALLLPADGPDPNPQKIIEDLRSQDPTPINPLCSATSRIRITNTKTGKDGVPGSMIFQTIALDGKLKTVGGDEYYVKYTGKSRTYGLSPDAVAHITDLDNGQYELLFVQPYVPVYSGSTWLNGLRRHVIVVDEQAGKLEVSLDYTCGIGKLWPPAKNKWIDGGSINSHWEVEVNSSMVPSITMTKDRALPQQFGSNFGNYDAIYAVGDSLMRQFVNDEALGRDNPILRRSNFFINPHGVALNMKSLRGWAWQIDKLLKEHPDVNNGNSAIVLGSGVWDLALSDESIESHIEALGKYIKSVQHRAPLAHIYWKSMTGVHISVFDEASVRPEWLGPARDRLKYCSRSRAKELYEAQAEVMQKMEIPVLDMFNLTFEAEEWHVGNDALHYQPKFNDFLMNYFYSPDLSTASVHRKP